MTARLLRPILAALSVLAVSLSVLAGPVAAHSSQAGSTPEDGEVLATAPSLVEVRFDSPLLDVGAAIVVRDAAGASVTTGAPRIDRQRISIDVDPAAAPGDYTVAYRVVAEDGHAIESTFGYTVQGDVPASLAPSASPATAAAADAPAPPTESDSSPPYLLIVGGVLVLLLAGAGALALRR